MTVTFPSNYFDVATDFLGTMGSFWRYDFSDRGQLLAEFDGLSELFQQHLQDHGEHVDLLGVATSPIFHRQRLWSMTVKQSEMNAGSATALRYYPGRAVYGNQLDSNYGLQGQVFTYGGQGPSGGLYAFDIPTTLRRGAYFVTNKLRNPDVVLISGMDFVIDTDVNGIFFTKNPFELGFEQRPVLDDDNDQTDTEITLWFWNTDWEWDYLYKQHGYAYGIEAKSSSYYRDMLVAYQRMITRCNSVPDMMLFLSGAVGIPVALEAETVELILTYVDKKQIITDMNVYEGPVNATVVVAVEDELVYGDPLFDTIELIELSGASYDISTVDRLPFSRNFLSGGYIGELTFENTIVSLDWGGYDGDGKAVVTFEVSGYNDDVEAFWDTTLANGKLAGKQTLAEMLDTRTNPIGQPNVANIPETINPLDYVIDNIFKNNLFLIRVKSEDCGVNAPGLSFAKLLRNVVPPHTTFILIVKAVIATPEQITIDGTGITVLDGASAAHWGASVDEPLDLTFGDQISEQ